MDDRLEKLLQKYTADNGIQLTVFNSPIFLNTKQELSDWFGNRKRFFHNDFYIHQQKKHHILIDAAGKPLVDKWSYATEKRFYDFGKCKDAIVSQENILHHSVLTPLLNVGLLTPDQVLEKTFEFAGKIRFHIIHCKVLLAR